MFLVPSYAPPSVFYRFGVRAPISWISHYCKRSPLLISHLFSLFSCILLYYFYFFHLIDHSYVNEIHASILIINISIFYNMFISLVFCVQLLVKFPYLKYKLNWLSIALLLVFLMHHSFNYELIVLAPRVIPKVVRGGP